MFKKDDIVVCIDVTTNFKTHNNGDPCWRAKLSVGDIGKVIESVGHNDSIRFERDPSSYQILNVAFRAATPEEIAVYKNGQTNVGNGIGTSFVHEREVVKVKPTFKPKEIVVCIDTATNFTSSCGDTTYRRKLGVGQICRVSRVDTDMADPIVIVHEDTNNFWITSEAFRMATPQEEDYYEKYYSSATDPIWSKDVSGAIAKQKSSEKVLKKCDFSDFKEGMYIRVKNSSGEFEGIAYKERDAWYCATNERIGSGGNTIPVHYRKDYQYSWSISTISYQGSNWGHSTIEVTILRESPGIAAPTLSFNRSNKSFSREI